MRQRTDLRRQWKLYYCRLYICRELCERHGATMGYERSAAGSASNAREGNEFMVIFAPAAGPIGGLQSFDRISA